MQLQERMKYAWQLLRPKIRTSLTIAAGCYLADSVEDAHAMGDSGILLGEYRRQPIVGEVTGRPTGATRERDSCTGLRSLMHSTKHTPCTVAQVADNDLDAVIEGTEV